MLINKKIAELIVFKRLPRYTMNLLDNFVAGAQKKAQPSNENWTFFFE